MKKSQFYTLSGALLASTALSGVAEAATIGRVAVATSLAAPAVAVSTALPVATTIFSATAATANAVNFQASTATQSPAVTFANNLNKNQVFNATIDIAGATMNNPLLQVSILARQNGTASFIGTLANCATVTPLVDKILINGCVMSGGINAITASIGAGYATAAFAGGLKLSGMVLLNASGLATAGGSVSLSGTVNDNTNPAIILETITSGNIITSALPMTTTVTAGGTAITNAATTPVAFSNFTAGAGAGLTVTLATVNITAAAVVGTDMTTQVIPDATGAAATALAGTVSITVTSAMLSDDAVTAARVTGAAGNINVLTPAAFPTGVATFNTSAAAGVQTFAGANVISATFSGTAAINAAVAGTVAVSYGNSGAGQGGGQAQASGSGATSIINSGGFNTEFNTAVATGNGDFASFVRIHNNGGAAGAVTITVLQESDGTNLGSHTTASVPVGGTIQVPMSDIETGAGITAPAGTYTLQLSGPIVGYAQHVLFNATTGQFTDLSSFRNGGAAAP